MMHWWDIILFLSFIKKLFDFHKAYLQIYFLLAIQFQHGLDCNLFPL